MQQSLLDLLQGNSAVHGILIQRIRIQITDMGTTQHHSVVMRLMAVTVDQHNILRTHQCLDHDLVRGRGTVGREKRVFGTKGASSVGLRFLDRTVRLQQRIKPARGRRSFCQKNTDTVKVDHIANPVRLGHRLAPRDRHRMEDTGWLATVLTQRREERGLIARADTPQNTQMQLEIIFLAIENPAETLGHITGNLLHSNVGHQIQIQLWTQVGNHPPQQRTTVRIRLFLGLLIIKLRQQALQNIQLPHRAERKPVTDHTGLNIMVKQGRNQRIFKTRYDHHLVNKPVFGAAHIPQPLA